MGDIASHDICISFFPRPQLVADGGQVERASYSYPERVTLVSCQFLSSIQGMVLTFKTLYILGPCLLSCKTACSLRSFGDGMGSGGRVTVPHAIT